MSSGATARTSESATSSQGGLSTLDALAHAARQVALYGPEHPIAIGALGQARAAVAGEAARGALEIRTQEEGLVWNGQLLELRDGNAARFHGALRRWLIAGLEISPSVQPAELARLLLLLAEEPGDSASRGECLLDFAAGVGGSIRLEEIDFASALPASEVTWRRVRRAVETEETGALGAMVGSCLGELRKMEGSGGPGGSQRLLPEGEGGIGDQPVEVAVAEGVTRIVQAAGEASFTAGEEEWEAWREEMVRHVTALSPEMRSRILRSPGGDSPGAVDMLAMVVEKIDLGQCVSMVLDHPDSLREGRSEGLRLALARIMSDVARRREMEEMLHEEATARGVSEDVYQNVVGTLISEGPREPEEAPARERVEETSPEEVVWAPSESLSDLMATTEEGAVRQSRTALLADSLWAELSERQFGLVVRLLGGAAAESAERGEPEGLLEALSGLEEAASAESGLAAARREMAAEGLASTGREQIVSCLVEASVGVERETRRRILRALGGLGEHGMVGLVRIAEASEEGDLEAALRALIEADSQGLVGLDQVLAHATKKSLGRMMRLVVENSEARAAEQLGALVDRMGAADRLEVIRLVRETRGRRFGGVLAKLVSDGSEAVRHAAVTALGELRARDGVSALCDLVCGAGNFGEGAALKEAAVRALGEIGDGRAVPALCEVLLGGGVLSVFGSPRPKVAAAEVLARMGGPDVEEALRLGCRRVSPTVRAACREALFRLELWDRGVRKRSRDVR